MLDTKIEVTCHDEKMRHLSIRFMSKRGKAQPMFVNVPRKLAVEISPTSTHQLNISFTRYKMIFYDKNLFVEKKKPAEIRKDCPQVSPLKTAVWRPHYSFSLFVVGAVNE